MLTGSLTSVPRAGKTAGASSRRELRSKSRAIRSLTQGKHWQVILRGTEETRQSSIRPRPVSFEVKSIYVLDPRVSGSFIRHAGECGVVAPKRVPITVAGPLA